MSVKKIFFQPIVFYYVKLEYYWAVRKFYNNKYFVNTNCCKTHFLFGLPMVSRFKTFFLILILFSISSGPVFDFAKQIVEPEAIEICNLVSESDSEEKEPIEDEKIKDSKLESFLMADDKSVFLTQFCVGELFSEPYLNIPDPPPRQCFAG
ncbi:MAG: hypothetical protein DWQ02_26600 [Bacteroidetes bacterium]|nr:MAG: hypothetical protein DWQ02_26600 [Bacteroidota bacterium]